MGDARPTARRRQRVLAVEDDPVVSESFKTLLELLGNEVCAVMSGAAALDAARAFRPDIAFIDIDLPGVDGYEVAARLREEHGRRIRLYALTGFARPADRERALSAGFDVHIVKPVDIAVLKALLAEDEAEPGSGTRHSPP
ncbi:MAG TPA: response regulator [Burkholderiales bacterium]